MLRWLRGHDAVITPFIRIQLAIFLVLTVLALGFLGWYYLRLPERAGIGQYTLHADSLDLAGYTRPQM